MDTSASFVDLIFALQVIPRQMISIFTYTTAPRSRFPSPSKVGFFLDTSVPGPLSGALSLQFRIVRLLDLERKALTEGVPGFMAELACRRGAFFSHRDQSLPAQNFFLFVEPSVLNFRLLSDSALAGYRCSSLSGLTV